MKKVAFLDKGHPYLLQQLQHLGYQLVHHEQTALEELLPLLPALSGIVLRSRLTLDQAFLERCHNLEFIARMGIGLEHVDLDYADSRGIKVLNSPEGSRDTVAEHTLGLILGLLHRLQQANLQIRAGKWERKRNRGSELRHRTVGLIGYGNIGRAVAQRLSCFGCRTIAYDKFKTNYGDQYAEAVNLAELQAFADVVSIHIPFSEANHHFIDADLLAAFSRPIFLVNTARGLVLDTSALAIALQQGQVIGAALDVLEYEEQAFNQLDLDRLPAPFQYLRQVENVILTPHTAGLSHEVMEAHAKVLAQKIAALR